MMPSVQRLPSPRSAVILRRDLPDPDPEVGSGAPGTASTEPALRAAAQTQPAGERALLVSLSEIGQQLPVVVIEETPQFILIDGYKRVRR